MLKYNKNITRDFSPSTKVIPWESDSLDLSWVEEEFAALS